MANDADVILTVDIRILLDYKRTDRGQERITRAIGRQFFLILLEVHRCSCDVHSSHPQPLRDPESGKKCL
jgi:hypothetical protein